MLLGEMLSLMTSTHHAFKENMVNLIGKVWNFILECLCSMLLQLHIIAIS